MWPLRHQRQRWLSLWQRCCSQSTQITALPSSIVSPQSQSTSPLVSPQSITSTSPYSQLRVYPRASLFSGSCFQPETLYQLVNTCRRLVHTTQTTTMVDGTSPPTTASTDEYPMDPLIECGNHHFHVAFERAKENLCNLHENPHTYSIRGELLKCARLFAVAESTSGVQAVFNTLQSAGRSPGEEEYRCLLESYLFSGNIDATLSTLSMMRDDGVNLVKETWCLLFEGFKAHSTIASLEKDLARRAIHVAYETPSIEDYLVLVAASKKAQSVQVVQSVFEHAFQTLKGDIPLVMWNGLLELLGSMRDMKQTEALLHFILDEGFQPNMDTHAFMLDAYGRNHNLRNAVDVFRKVENEYDVLSENVYLCMLNAYAQGSKEEKALALVNKMRLNGVPLSSLAYGKLAKVHSRCSNPAAIKSLFAKMYEDNIPISEELLRSLMYAYAKSFQTWNVEEIFHDLLEKGITPSAQTYNILVLSHVMVDQIGVAHSILANMLDNGVRPLPVTYNILLNAYARRRELAVVYELLDDMMEVRVPVNQVTCNTLIKAMCMNGDAPRAEGLVHHMLERGIQTDITTWGTLIGCYARNSDFDKLLLTVERAIDHKCAPNKQPMEIMAYFLNENSHPKAQSTWDTIQFLVSTAREERNADEAKDYWFWNLSRHNWSESEQHQQDSFPLDANSSVHLNSGCINPDNVVSMLPRNETKDHVPEKNGNATVVPKRRHCVG
eukprot:m.33483 g.33483  ORF g.33483 m.33483 type:complete len:723 (-) comp6450_c1_seq1:37-2205(-)